MSEQIKTAFDEFTEEYQESKKPSFISLTKEEKKSHVFTPKTDTEEFRLLPPKEGEKLFETAHFHEVNVNGMNQKIYCPKHNDGGECPLCDKYELELKKQDGVTDKDIKDEIFKKAVKWKSVKYFIARGIDQGNLKAGIKFWRFRESRKNDGILDKIIAVNRVYQKQNGIDISDVNKGTNLVLNVVDDFIPHNKVKYRKVNMISADVPSKITESDIKTAEILKDPISWRQIFPPQTLPGHNIQQYLESVVKGTTPTWDKDRKVWVNKDGSVLEYAKDVASDKTSAGTNKTEFTKTEMDNENSKDTVDDISFDSSDNDDDLPF